MICRLIAKMTSSQTLVSTTDFPHIIQFWKPSSVVLWKNTH